jgi:phosphohistidine swiveling domain-containing protein
MSAGKLELLDEGSWALMIEESNVRALQRYHGSMAGLDIDYYLSVGVNRYYKGYFSEEELGRVRRGIVRFLLDDVTYRRCVTEIRTVMDRLRNAGDTLAARELPDQFAHYCDLLCEYISYYNSVITDTFYADVFDVVDGELPAEARFAAKAIKDALFATDNNDLLTHQQAVDLLALSRRHLDGQDVGEIIADFIERYRSNTVSSGSPDGITAAEVRDHLAHQTADSVRSEEAFMRNLHFRYSNAAEWSVQTAGGIGLSESTQVLVRRACELSHLKILMREEFQQFKVTARRTFLSDLIAAIGKKQFDYMRIKEIADFIRDGARVAEAELARRRILTVFELVGDDIAFLEAVPPGAEVKGGPGNSVRALSGDVLVGTGTKRYRVRKVEQHEEGLSSFDRFVQDRAVTEDIAVITNVLRPHLVPKLKKFGALITQYGGYTSHASVLCRELGINSMISVNGLLDALETDDRIEVDFDNGLITKVIDGADTTTVAVDYLVPLGGQARRSAREVGAKAASLMRISDAVTIAPGFVLTAHALRSVDEPAIREAVLAAVAALKCDRLVIRSSHENEDSAAGSYAGLFESYVDVDAHDSATVIELAKAVYSSQKADSVSEYGRADGDMAVLIQEMISADVSGVVLTSNTFDGYDYLLFEYVVGDLWHLMQGDVTPLGSYLRKSDVIEDRQDIRSYPAIVSVPLARSFRVLARIALEMERLFSRRVQIEWGMKEGQIYVFQVRPY